jgi:hypothetical protein
VVKDKKKKEKKEKSSKNKKDKKSKSKESWSEEEIHPILAYQKFWIYMNLYIHMA